MKSEIWPLGPIETTVPIKKGELMKKVPCAYLIHYRMCHGKIHLDSRVYQDINDGQVVMRKCVPFGHSNNLQKIRRTLHITPTTKLALRKTRHKLVRSPATETLTEDQKKMFENLKKSERENRGLER